MSGQTYKDDIRDRFVKAMKSILFARINECKIVSQFAKSIGEYQQNISKIEKGERYPTLDHIARLCDVFNYSAEWLYSEKEI